MSRFKDRLWSDLVQEHGPTLALAAGPEQGRARLRRPRILAGSTLGLAGVGAAVLLILGGSAAPAAFAITTNGDGSVLVTINKDAALPQVNAKLAAMGTHEQIAIEMVRGAAAASGPINCVPTGAGVSGPAVKALVGTNGTEVISAGNTGAGTWHLAGCHLYSTSTTGGNSLYGESPAAWSTAGNTGTADTP